MCKADHKIENLMPAAAQVEPFYCFPTAVYSVKAPQFLDETRAVVSQGNEKTEPDLPRRDDR